MGGTEVGPRWDGPTHVFVWVGPRWDRCGTAPPTFYSVGPSYPVWVLYNLKKEQKKKEGGGVRKMGGVGRKMGPCSIVVKPRF